MEELNGRFIIFSLVVLCIIFVLGLTNQLNVNINVDPEYINGVLTASSILFGFWGLLLEKIYNSSERLYYKATILKAFIASIISLFLTILSIVSSALKVTPSIVPLLIISTSFFINIYLIFMSIYYYIFEKREA